MVSENPVFLLAGGGRTGSTLVQRLLLSSRRVLVWGEHGGVLLSDLMAIESKMRAWLEVEAEGHADNFLRLGHNSWVANMTPGADTFRAGAKAYLDESLGAAAARLNFPRWGFKEIRYGRDAALFLHSLYPDGRFLIVIRDPVACLQSIKGTGWYLKDFAANPRLFLSTWARLTRELVELQPQLPHALVVRYEDLLARPGEMVARIEKTCGLPAGCVNMDVFGSSVRGTDSPPMPVQGPDRMALLDDELRRVAAMVGYPL